MRTKDKLKSLINKKVKDGVFQERFVPAIQPSDPRPPEYDKTISESGVWHNRAESTPKGMKIPYKPREGRGSTKREDELYTGRGTGKIHHVDPTKFSMRIARPMDKKHIGRRARQMKEETNRTARIPDIQVSRGKDGKLHLHHEDGRHELHAAARAGIKTMPIRLTPGFNTDNVKDIDPTNPKHVRAEEGSGEYIQNKRRHKKIYGYGGKREPKRSRSEREEKIRQGMESLKAIDKLKAILNKDENKINDEYHKVMEEAAKERKGNYDRNTSTYHRQDGMPVNEHCGATSTVLERMGRGKKVEGNYHGTWDGKPVEHSWVEDDKGNIIDASRDQFHGMGHKGIHTITPDHPHYKHYKKNPPCKDCGSTAPRKNYTNLYSFCSGENCRNMKDRAPEEFEKFYGRKHKNVRELSAFRKQAEKEGNMIHGHTQKRKAINKLKAILNKDAMSKLSRFNPNKIIHTRRDPKIGRKSPKDLKGTKTDVPTYNTSSGQREATLLGNTRIPVQQEEKINRFNERYNVERPSKVPYKKRLQDWHKDTQKPTSFKENILQPRKPDKHDRDFEDRIERRDTKPYSFDHDIHTEFITMPSGRKVPKEAKIDMLREHQQDREQEKQRKINEGTDYNHRKYGHGNKILTSNPSRSTGKLRRTVDNKKLMEQVKDKENKREAKRWKEEDPDRVYVNQSAIDKLKAMSLLSITLKEGETNSGEKSHIKDSKRKEKETQTPDNYDNREYTTNWRKHDIDDRDQHDKDYYYN